jgi:hypothetical protein
MEVYPLGGGPGLWVFLVFLFPLVLLIIPWVFFLLNLRGLLWRVNPQNRAMPPEQVWLNFIPVFGLGWFIYTVAKVRESVRAEYRSRGWDLVADFGYNVGLAAGILWICVAFFVWIPFLGWAVAIAWLVCWIIYWLKTSDLKHQLEVGPPWFGPGAPPPYRDYGDGSPGYGPPAPGAPWNAPASTGGPRAPQVKQCAVCGRTIAPDDRFCRTCGLRLP